MPSPTPGIGRRMASMLYEGLVVFAVLLIAFWLPQTLLSAAGIVIGAKMLWLHVFILLLVYFVWFWLNGGQTLPMKTWKLRVVGGDGKKLRPLQAVLRYLAAWPCILFFGIGMLWALIDRDKQFLHDRIAGSRIVLTD